jgi:hypothetical protein
MRCYECFWDVHEMYVGQILLPGWVGGGVVKVGMSALDEASMRVNTERPYPSAVSVTGPWLGGRVNE